MKIPPPVRLLRPSPATSVIWDGRMGGTIHIVQGEDMGQRCKLRADIPLAPGSSIRVSGNAKIVAADVTLEELAL